MLWDAFYCITPFDPPLKKLIEVEASIRRDEPLYPPECKYNQPIEDIIGPANTKKLIAMLNSVAATYKNPPGRQEHVKNG